MLHPPSLDEEQLLKSPVPASKITSQRRKWNKQANKLKRETAAFCDEVLWTREKKVLANSSCPSLSDLGKAPAGRLGKMSFPCFSLFSSSVFFFLSMVLVIIRVKSKGCRYCQGPGSLQGPEQGLGSATESLDGKCDVVT